MRTALAARLCVAFTSDSSSPTNDDTNEETRDTAPLRVVLSYVPLLVPLAGLIVASHLMPEGWASTAGVSRTLRSLRQDELGFIYVCAAYALMASVFVPIMALITATALIFEPTRAFAYALTGSLLSAALSYGCGRIGSARILRLLKSPRMHRLRARLEERALEATVIARLLPVGNFNAINLLAGALAIPFGAFMLGNVIGMVCGIAGLTVLANRLAATLESPSWQNVGVSVAVVVLVVGVSLGLGRLVGRARRR